MKEKSLELNTSKQKLLGLVLTVPPIKSIHDQTKKWLLILKLKYQGQKRPQLENIDLRMICEKLPLGFTISNESYVFP